MKNNIQKKKKQIKKQQQKNNNKKQFNDLRIIICLKKSEVTIVIISVCNVIENLAEHGIGCLPYSYINDILDLLKQ